MQLFTGGKVAGELHLACCFVVTSPSDSSDVTTCRGPTKVSKHLCTPNFASRCWKCESEPTERVSSTFQTFGQGRESGGQAEHLFFCAELLPSSAKGLVLIQIAAAPHEQGRVSLSALQLKHTARQSHSSSTRRIELDSKRRQKHKARCYRFLISQPHDLRLAASQLGDALARYSYTQSLSLSRQLSAPLLAGPSAHTICTEVPF